MFVAIMWIRSAGWWSACWLNPASGYIWDEFNEAWLASGLSHFGFYVAASSLICFDLNCILVFQESGRHSETLDAITTYLDMGMYSEWDEDKRLEFLTRELKGKRPLVPLTIDVSCSFDISILEDNVVHVSPIGRDKSMSICRIL